MSKETRKQLASLTFSEKLKLLDKLRERDHAIAAAREKLKKLREQKKIVACNPR